MNIMQNASISSPKSEAVTRTPRIVRLPEVKTLTALSRTTLYDRMKDGTFPHTVQLGGRLVGWLESEVRGWIEARIAGTRQ